jgi:uncharacterized protein (TIGR02996 family)
MSEEQSFLQHLATDPLDDTTRLVYADWLEERGDVRGEYLRLELELAQLDESDARLAELEERGRRLREGIDPEWLRQAGKPFDVWLVSYIPTEKIRTIRRIRELTGMGLAKAKHFSEAVPARVLARGTRAQAEQVREHLLKPCEYTSTPLAPGTIQVCIRAADAASPTLPFDLPPLSPPRPVALYLDSVHPSDRIAVIRALRQITGRGMMECREMTRGSFPVLVRQGITRQEAEHMRDLFPALTGLTVAQMQ